MGKYAALFYLAKEARGYIPDSILIRMTEDEAFMKGYHPLAETGVVSWHEVSPMQEMVERSIYDGEPGLRAGDWGVRVVVEVQEDAEIDQPRDPD